MSLRGRGDQISMLFQSADAGIIDALQSFRDLLESEHQLLTNVLSENKELVMDEAPPEKFLRLHNMDSVEACQRMVSYWEVRASFLQGSAYSHVRESLAMPPSILTVSDDTTMVLPFDKANRSVLYINGPENLQRDSKLLFQCTQLATENPVSSTDGLFVIHNLEKGADDVVLDVARFLSSAIPARIKHYVLICSSVEYHQGTATKLRRVVEQLSLSEPAIKPIILTTSITDTLEEMGLSKANLPRAIGGSFQTEDFVEFLGSFSDKTLAPVIREDSMMALIKNSLACYIGRKVVSSKFASTVEASKEDTGSVEPCEDFSLSSQATKEALIANPGLAMQQIEEAMDFLSDSEKQSFQEAKRRAPQLILDESNPQWYLHAENFNVWSAARRLGCYWRIRQGLFQERAFYPLVLHQKIESALTSVDKEILEKGLFGLGPEDDKGRVVLFFNRARISGNKFAEPEYTQNRLRCLFFMLQLAGERESVRKNGIVAIGDYGARKAYHSFLSSHRTKFILEMVQMGAFPLSLKQSHLILRPGQAKWAPSIISALYKVYRNSSELMKNTFLHIGNDANKLWAMLERYGFRKEGLYPALGGNWSYKVEIALTLEYRSYQDGIRNALPEDDGLNVEEGKVLSREEFRLAMKRKRHKNYSKRLRKKNKIEQSVWETRLDESVAQNKQLKEENGRLQILLQQAQEYEIDFGSSRRVDEADEITERLHRSKKRRTL